MKIAIVDDSESSLDYMAGLVGSIANCSLVTFQESWPALTWCLDNDVDLIIVDYEMPAPDGLRFIEIIHSYQAKKDVPIIMVTSSSVRDIRYEALQLGATDFLNKPIDAVEFVARVQNALSAYKSHKVHKDLSKWLGGEIQNAKRQLVEREGEIIQFLARTAEHRDPETGRHISRMAHYSRLIAEKLKLPSDEVEDIYTASPLHDLGKVGIPDKILLKPGVLDASEFSIMKQHTTFGHEILAGSKSHLLQLARDICYCHHERMDGSGYPRGLKGEQIPLSSRIVALADVFDALISTRPYKEGWEVSKAREYVESKRGSHFCAECVDAFLATTAEVNDVIQHLKDNSSILSPKQAYN